MAPETETIGWNEVIQAFESVNRQLDVVLGLLYPKPPVHRDSEATSRAVPVGTSSLG